MKGPRSELVDHVMANASPEERAVAARQWFAFLRILSEIAERQIRERDSRDSPSDDRVAGINHNL